MYQQPPPGSSDRSNTMRLWCPNRQMASSNMISPSCTVMLYLIPQRIVSFGSWGNMSVPSRFNVDMVVECSLRKQGKSFERTVAHGLHERGCLYLHLSGYQVRAPEQAGP